MTYELACELSDKVTAFGSVAGNFMLNSDRIQSRKFNHSFSWY